MRVGLIGDPALLALHGADGDFAWGQLRMIDERTTAERFQPEVVFSLGRVPEAHEELFADSRLRAIWNVRPGDASGGVATLGPGGRRLWRLAPLPVGDALFDFAPTRTSVVLVVGGDQGTHDDVVGRLREHDHDVRACLTPTPEDLAEAGVVAVAAQPGAPLSALVPPALASGRVVLAPPAEPTFGLGPGVDYLVHTNPDELTMLADAAVAFPDTFDSVVALGRLRAEAQRASVVYGRIAADLVAA